MKVLLAYAGKHSSTRESVERLANALPRGVEVTVAHLEEDAPDPSAFDLTVLGSSVYFGKLRPAAREYLKKYTTTLLQKPLGLFLVCGLAHEYEYYRDKLLPKELRDHAFETLYFGGSLSTKGLSPLEWLLVRSMRSSLFEEDISNNEFTPTLPSLLPENIDRMATYVRHELQKIADAEKKS